MNPDNQPTPIQPAEGGEKIQGPCSYCGSPEHWRPDCPHIGEVIRANTAENCLKAFSKMVLDELKLKKPENEREIASLILNTIKELQAQLDAARAENARLRKLQIPQTLK